jgi:riboflavin kinase/FMN adenylyltransferase
VVSGHGIGQQKTVPTLNLAPENELRPATGVYVTKTRDLDSGSIWTSITNVGYRPTFDGSEPSYETFILDPYDGNAPHRIEVSFFYFIREERKFGSPELLRAQILKDVDLAKRVHFRIARFRV